MIGGARGGTAARSHGRDPRQPRAGRGRSEQGVNDLERSQCRTPEARQSERAFRGTRASANTSGPDFSRALDPAKLRSKDSAPNEENLFLLPDRFWKSELSRKSIQPFDLMSRRHPLSSTRATRFRFASRSRSADGSCDVPASSRRQFLEKRSYFFFLATLRVFFAVFFTALFAFFAFLAFLAMLPS
jgi:hypothetical protein